MLLPLAFLILSLLISSIHSIQSDASSSSSSSSNIYDVLKLHGLPMGLLPKGVTNFTLEENGRFEVHLEKPCDAKFDNLVRYDINVTGILSYGQIGSLSGISAQELFLWFQVKGIRVDIPSSGLIYFDVGVVYKQFSLSLFENPRVCKAVDDQLEPPQDGNFMVPESKSGKLQYKINQEDLQKAVI